MLLALQLRDFVIVDSLELEFGPGFSVLSGETGAGKSILLDALALVTGARADPGFVREGCARADIAAQFRTDAALDDWLAQRELAGDPGVVLLRRVIDTDGRSRALVNGQPATAALLREIGERLLDIHGQHAAQSLLRADGQRLLLDAFAGLDADVRSVAETHAQWRALAPAWPLTRNSTRSMPLADGSALSMATSRRPPAMPSSPISRVTPAESCAPAAARRSDSARAATS